MVVALSSTAQTARHMPPAAKVSSATATPTFSTITTVSTLSLVHYPYYHTHYHSNFDTENKTIGVAFAVSHPGRLVGLDTGPCRSSFIPFPSLSSPNPIHYTYAKSDKTTGCPPWLQPTRIRQWMARCKAMNTKRHSFYLDSFTPLAT